MHRQAISVRNPVLRAALVAFALFAQTLAFGQTKAAEADKQVGFDIPAGSASTALKQFSSQSGQGLLYLNDDISGVTTKEVRGRLSVSQALNQLLDGTPLAATWDKKNGAVVVGRQKPEDSRPKGVAAGVGRADSGENFKMVGPAESADNVVRLDAFRVSSSGDIGFFSKNTMAGTRSSERLADIPQNIQIINSELLQALAQDNPIEALKYGSSGVNKRTSLLGDMFIRGFRVRGFLMDNVPFGSNFNVPQYDIDRLEMVKGPAALLYGQASSTGGLMNFITKRPSEKRASSIRATIGSFDLYRVEATTTGPLGVADSNYRATVAATDSDGPRKFDYFKDRFFSMSVDTRLTSTTALSIDYKYYHKDNVLSQINANTNGDLTQVSDDFSFFEAWQDGPNHAHFASVSLRNEITPTLVSSLVLNFNQMDTDWNRLNANGLTDATTNIVRRTYQNVFQQDKNMVAMVDFVKTFSTAGLDHKVSFGGIAVGNHGFGVVDSVLYSTLNTRTPVYGAAFPTFSRGVATPGQPNPSWTNTRSRQDSGYIQEQVSAFDNRLIVVGGLRYNEFHTTTTNVLNRALTTLDDNQLVKRFGVVAKPVRSVSLYYNYSESFIFNTGTFNGGPRSGEPLEPSLGKNKEAGIKVETSDGRLFGSVAVYDLSLTKVRVLFPLPDGTGGIGQSGTETNKGYEADIGTYFETPIGPFQTILTYYKGDQKDSAGIRPNGVTNDTWSVYVSQGIGTGALTGFKFGFGLYRKGETPFASIAGQVKRFIAPAYTTSNAMIAYDRKNFRISVNVDNVFGEDFIDGGENATWLYTSPGLTFKLGFEYRF